MHPPCTEELHKSEPLLPFFSASLLWCVRSTQKFQTLNCLVADLPSTTYHNCNDSKKEEKSNFLFMITRCWRSDQTWLDDIIKLIFLDHIFWLYGISRIYFFLTRLWSLLPCLVTNYLTDSLMLLRLERCDSGWWRCLLKSCWRCRRCWHMCWGRCRW